MPIFIGLAVLAVLVLVGSVLVLSGGDDGEPASSASEASSDPSAPGGATGTSGDDVRIVELGTIEPGAAISVDIEEGDVSFLLTTVGEDPEEFLTYTEVVAPSGAAVYEADIEAGTAEGGLTGFTRSGTGEASLIVPAHPGLDIEPGTYEVEVDNVVPVEATAVIKSGSVAPEVTQAIDLNIWLLSADYDQATLESELENRVNAVLKPQNLEAGVITFTQASDEAIESVGVVDSDGLLSEVCAAMRDEVGSARALNLAIIETFHDATAGLASGLPGGPQVPESTSDCVIAATQVDGERIDLPLIGSTIVHEAAHLFGLFHTTESDGASGDDFEDTPECVLEEVDGRDGFGYPGEEDGMISATECGVEGGAANFMFFEDSPLDTRDVLSQLEMSDDQAWAMRRHPLFYPVEGDGSAAADDSPAPEDDPLEPETGDDGPGPEDDLPPDGGAGEVPAAVSVTTIAEYGTDPRLDGFADSCEAGDFAACDDLYFQSAIDSDYEAYGTTCGGRLQPTGGFCAEAFGG